MAVAAARGGVEEELTEERLQVLCGTQFLTSVDFLELRVDATLQGIDTLGSVLPNLTQLKLSCSAIASVRDLGTGLTNLQVLWINRCGLQDLSGLACLSNLRELFAAFNDVADLSPLGMHEALEVLDLEGNAVCEVEEVGSLWMCPELKELTLAGNPVCKEEGFSRRAVANLLPQLQVLDEVPLAAAPSLTDKGGAATEFFQLHDNCDVFDIASLSDDEDDEEVLPGEESEPLAEFTHPLLVEAIAALDEGVHVRQELSRLVGEDEPDEDALVLERLKERRALGKQRFAFRAEARQVEAPAAASDLTCGAALAGSPLSAARLRRRKQGAHDELNEDEALPRSCRQESLRQLIRKHQAEVDCSKDRHSQQRPPTRASQNTSQEERVVPVRPQQTKQKGQGRPCSAVRKLSSAKLATGYPTPKPAEAKLAAGYPTPVLAEAATPSSTSSPGSRRPPLAPTSMLTVAPTSPLKRSCSRGRLSSASTSPNSSRCSTPLAPLQQAAGGCLPLLQASTSFSGDPYSRESEGMVWRGAPPADGGFAGIDFGGGALLQKELRAWSALGLGLKASPLDRPSSRGAALKLVA